MNSEWKEIIEQEMEREAELMMEEVNSDPVLKDVQAPPDLYDKIYRQICEYEKQKVYDQLSEEDREYLRIGKAYMKRRRLNRHIVLVTAIVMLFAMGTVSVCKDKNIFHLFSRMFSGGERTTVDTEDVEPVLYVDENEVYEEIEEVYGFVPVKLGYLPENTKFYEATINQGIQSVNMIYQMSDKSSLVYIIRPNYRDAAFGTVIEDEKVQDYQMIVNNIEVMMTEYVVAETDEKQWSICFVYEDVTYMLRVSNMKKEEVERIVMNLKFAKQ